MDTDKLREVVPHYVAMLFLIFVVLGALRATNAVEMNFLVELAVILAVVAGYRVLLGRLGYLPDAWQQ